MSDWPPDLLPWPGGGPGEGLVTWSPGHMVTWSPVNRSPGRCLRSSLEIFWSQSLSHLGLPVKNGMGEDEAS